MKIRQTNIASDRLNREIRDNKKELLRLNHKISAQAEEFQAVNEKLTDLTAFKDLMTGFLDHDLENALNIVVNADFGSDPERKLAEIRNIGKRMLSIVHNMLGIMGFESGSLALNTRAISYNEMVMNVFRRVSMQAATRNITLSFNQKTNYILLADADITERVFVNLLDNAIRHAPAGSAIAVIAEMLDGFVKTTVKDHGDGIAPDLLPFIFEKYIHGEQGAWDKTRLYGLGLTFCIMAVEKQGGKTGAISEKGKGSEIWFTLPMTPGDAIHMDYQLIPAVSSGLQEMPELTETELAWLREHYGSIRHISIHQISDIKDLLGEPDENASVGIIRWKKALITATNQYNLSSFNHLAELIPENNG